MFPSQATSGLGSGTPVTIRYEDFEELADDIKRQLEAKRLASSIPACENGSTATDSEGSSDVPSKHSIQNETLSTSSNLSVPFVPFGVNDNTSESLQTLKNPFVPPTSQEMDLKAIVPTAPFLSPPYEVNPFFLSLPVLGNPAVSPMSTMNDGILEPVTSTSCTPSFASSIGGVTNFGTVPISGSSLLLSATGTGSTQPTASTGCDPSLESLLATMNKFGTIPAPPGSALVLGNGSLPNSQELSESPIKKFPKLFHMGNGLLQPTTPAPNSFGEMPILQKSPLVSEVAPVSSEPVTPAACGLLGSKSSDLNIFGGMPLLENSVLVSETGAKSSILQTTDFSGLVPPKTSDLNVCGTVAVSGDLLLLSATGTGSTQLTTPTTCPPLAAITSETNFFEGMSISENSAHLDAIAKLSSKPTSSTAFTPLAPPADGANITAANSIPENSALLPAKAISPSMPATLVASAPTAPTVADKRISGTLTNSKSSALSSSVTNASLPPTTSAPGASHVPMPDINNFGTMSIFENPPLISAMVNLSSNPASSAALVSLAPIESETSVLTPMPALGNSALQSGTMSMSSGLKTSPGSSLVSISSDTNIFGTMSISDSTALLSALASLSSKPPLSAASAPFGPADASTSALPPTACASIAPIANPSIFPPMPVLDSSVIQSALLILQQQQQTSQPEMFALEKKKKKNGPSTSERSKDHADKKQNNTVQQPVPDSSTPYASSALAHLAALANSYNGLPDKSVQFYSSLPPTPSISQMKKQNKRRGYQNDRRSHTSRPTRPTVLDLLAENNKCVQPILCGTMFSSRPSNQQPSKPKKSPNQRKNIPLIDLTLESDHAGCCNSLQPSTSQRTLPQTASPTWLENVRIVQPGSPFVERQNFTVPHNLYELPPSNRLAPERQINENIEFHAVNFLKNQLGIAAPRKEKVDLEQLEREPFDTSIFLEIQDVDANAENYCYTMTGRMHSDSENKSRTPPIDFKEFFSVVGTEYCPLEEVLEIIKLFKPNEQRFLKHCGQFGQWRYETNLKCFQDFHQDYWNIRFVSLMSKNGTSNINCHEDMLQLENKSRIMKELMTKDLDEFQKKKFCSVIMRETVNMNKSFHENCQQFPQSQLLTSYNEAIVNRNLEPVMKHPEVDLPNYQVMQKTIDDAFIVVAAGIKGLSGEQMNEVYNYFKKDWAITGEIFEQLQHSSPEAKVPGLIAGCIFDSIRKEIQEVITKNNYWWYLDNNPPVFD